MKLFFFICAIILPKQQEFKLSNGPKGQGDCMINALTSTAHRQVDLEIANS